MCTWNTNVDFKYFTNLELKLTLNGNIVSDNYPFIIKSRLTANDSVTYERVCKNCTFSLSEMTNNDQVKIIKLY